MMEMKYVMIEEDFPIVFHSYLTHADVARGAGRVTSAGFVQQDVEGKYRCYGESLSLGIPSDPEQDSKVIHKFLTGVPV